MKKYVMQTAYNKNQLRKAFAKKIQASSLAHAGETVFVGKWSDASFYFYAKKGAFGNSFATVLRGKIREVSGGCELTWRYSKFYPVLVIGILCLILDLFSALIMTLGGSMLYSILSILVAALIFSLLFFPTESSKERLKSRLEEIAEKKK